MTQPSPAQNCCSVRISPWKDRVGLNAFSDAASLVMTGPLSRDLAEPRRAHPDRSKPQRWRSPPQGCHEFQLPPRDCCVIEWRLRSGSSAQSWTQPSFCCAAASWIAGGLGPVPDQPEPVHGLHEPARRVLEGGPDLVALVERPELRPARAALLRGRDRLQLWRLVPVRAGPGGPIATG